MSSSTFNFKIFQIVQSFQTNGALALNVNEIGLDLIPDFSHAGKYFPAFKPHKF